jgi:hypothetical protein
MMTKPHNKGSDNLKTVLSLCDHSGNAVQPWADAGYNCICVDLKHEGTSQEGNITFIGADVRSFELPELEYAFVFAFPPCTDLAVSGARWFKDKGLEALYEALGVVIACKKLCEQTGAPYLIENPISTLATYWRKPDHMFNPCDYAGYLTDPEPEAYTKKTCLWVGNGFRIPKPKPVFPVHGSKMHRLPPSEDRAELRAVTPIGFSQAVFMANA